MGFNYVVFGAGRQGTAAIHDLVANCEAGRVRVIEPSGEAAERCRGHLEPLLGGEMDRVMFARTAAVDDLAGADVALSCAPYRFNPELTALALEAGVPFCDLGGNPDVVARQQQMVTGANTTLPVVPDCGISPGLSNIIAVHLARSEGADAIHVRCGGIPVSPDAVDNPLKYKLVFDPQGLISEYSGRVPVLRNGQLRMIDALSSIEPFDGGRLEASPTSNNSPQVVEYLQSLGVREYDYMTLRYPGHWSIARAWKQQGRLCGDEAADAELADCLSSDPALRYDPTADRDRLILSVQGSSPLGRSATALRACMGFELDVAADRRTRFSAMELTTSWGITIVAYSMARRRGSGGLPAGFATPERFMDTRWTIEQLRWRVESLQ